MRIALVQEHRLAAGCRQLQLPFKGQTLIARRGIVPAIVQTALANGYRLRIPEQLAQRLAEIEAEQGE